MIISVDRSAIWSPILRKRKIFLRKSSMRSFALCSDPKTKSHEYRSIIHQSTAGHARAVRILQTAVLCIRTSSGETFLPAGHHTGSVAAPLFFRGSAGGETLGRVQVLDTFIVQTVDQSMNTLDRNITWGIAEWVYLLITAALFLVLMIRVVRLLWMAWRLPKEVVGNKRIIRIPEDHSPASFFHLFYAGRIIHRHRKGHPGS